MGAEPDASAGSPTGVPGRTRFLIGSVDPRLLADLPERLQGRAGVTVDRVLRTTSGVGGVVADMTPEVAAELRNELGPQIVIEEDRVLDEMPPPDPTLGAGS